jgi:hypothetical protein
LESDSTSPACDVLLHEFHVFAAAIAATTAAGGVPMATWQKIALRGVAAGALQVYQVDV